MTNAENTTTHTDSDLYDMYVEPSTTYAEIAAMDLDTMTTQIAELQTDEPNLDASHIAYRIQEYAAANA
jgi:hypothetical protein